MLLDLYRSTLQPLYPFVVVPSACSAAALLSTRPFLMAAIRMVASFRSPRSMQAQMYCLMAHVADHMLIRSERSLDLLQGIVVMLSWYHYHCFHAQLSNLVSLAMSLVAELGLNKPPMVRELANLVIVKPQEPSDRTNEERRALAAVWFMSVMSTVLGRIEPMRYSPYLHECVRDLEASREYETDTTLVSLVRIQHLTERICDQNARDRAWEEPPGIPTAPASAYVQAFQKELDSLRDSLPPGLRRDHMMQVHLNSATLRLYEPPMANMALVKHLYESHNGYRRGRHSPRQALPDKLRAASLVRRLAPCPARQLLPARRRLVPAGVRAHYARAVGQAGHSAHHIPGGHADAARRGSGQCHPGHRRRDRAAAEEPDGGQRDTARLGPPRPERLRDEAGAAGGRRRAAVSAPGAARTRQHPQDSLPCVPAWSRSTRPFWALRPRPAGWRTTSGARRRSASASRA